jgi:hypothetical protein
MFPMRFQKFLLALLLPWAGATLAAAATPLSSARVTEAKHDVLYKGETAGERAAKLDDVVRGADVLRTGERSLAEIEFDDKTITRLGSKSVFSFNAEAREFNVDRGLALICMPKGAGGGRIVTAAITAGIEGTTVLVLGTGKIIFLEGFGTISTRDGKQSAAIHGGQIALLENGVLKIYDVLLDPLLKGRFIKGRKQPLPTWAAITEVNDQQQDDVKRGKKSVAKGGGAPGKPPDVGDPAYRNEGMIGILLSGNPAKGGESPFSH